VRKTSSQIADEVFFKTAGLSEHFPKTLGHLQKLKEALGKKFEEKLFKTLEEKSQAIAARPEGEQDLLRRIGKNKTVSQLGDEVLEKLSIDLATLRRVSTGLLREHGVRGGRSTPFDRVWRKPIEPMGPEVFAGINQGRPVSPLRRALIRIFPSVKRLSRGTEFDPELLKQVPGPILSGGRGGTLSSLLQHHPAMTAGAPVSLPMGREILNRVALLHEGFERDALGSGMSVAERLRGWGKPVPSNIEGRISGMIGGGHMRPRVILKEHNVMSTLPDFTEKNNVREQMRRLRSADKTWPTIQHAVGGNLPYGQQRLSRHAIRRIEDLVRQGG
jgi:hypothetical protein